MFILLWKKRAWIAFYLFGKFLIFLISFILSTAFNVSTAEKQPLLTNESAAAAPLQMPPAASGDLEQQQASSEAQNDLIAKYILQVKLSLVINLMRLVF